MKKNFLFATLAALLAGFWFGGASLATDCTVGYPCETPRTSWEVMDWNDDYALKYYSDTAGFDKHPKLDGDWTVEVGEDYINYSGLVLKNQGDDGDVKNIGLLGMLFFVTGENVSNVTFEYNTYYKDGSRIFNSTSYSKEDGRDHTSFWYRITPDLVKQTLAAGSHVITASFVISGDNKVTYSSEIDITNFTLYNGDDKNNIFFQVKDGIVVIENGKIASEVMDYAAFHADKYPTGHEYQSVTTGEDFITFSGLTLKIYYPDADPVDKDIAYVMAAFFQAGGDNDWEHIYFNGKSFAQRVNDHDSASTEDGRLHSSLWIRVTPAKIKTALENGEHSIVEKFTVTSDYSYIKDKEYTITINIDNVKLWSGDSSNVMFEVVDGVITKIGGEDAVTVTFDGANEQVIASGTNAQKPADPTKDCNSFDGWYNGDEKFDFTTPVTGDLALTSKWTYTCSRSSGGGGGSSRTTTTSKDDTKANTGDTAKTDEQKVDENKTEEETVNEENKVEEKTPMTEDAAVSKFGQEQIDAYKWALENGITTMETVEEARLDYPLTRAELAKMMVVYIAKILGKQPVLTGNVDYQDVDANKLGDLAGYIQLAYQYQIMGIDANGDPIEFFNPNGLVTRGEYATVFSRVLFGALFNKEGADFYTDHIEALNKAGILSDTNPTQREMRGWVMLMMYRSTQNADKIAAVIEALGATEQEAADAQAKAEEEGVNEENAENAENAEATTGDVAEAPEAEASTGAVAE